ncbi:MAG: chromosome segregation ATPase [Acidimicrobiales bacterium]
MTTGEEEAESLVDGLFREVDDQFTDLEREYSQARKDLAQSSLDRPDTPSNALQASNERFELMSQVATLQAEVSRQSDELDERDRMLNELGDKIVGFETKIAQHNGVSTELRAARQESLDERREQARMSALLDARAAERQELVDVANRLQNDRDHVQELLTTALSRFDDAAAQMVQMDDKIRLLAAAGDTAAHEHDVRAHELIESRAEMSKLADRIKEMAKNTTDADQRAEKSEALAERRSNEAGYLNRRIDGLNDKLKASGAVETEATSLGRDLTIAERRITELERELATQRSETAAATAAVEAIAGRTSDYDEVVTKNEQLRQERDKARDTASGLVQQAPAEPEPSADLGSLAQRARELSARRANQVALAAEQAVAQAVAEVHEEPQSKPAPTGETGSTIEEAPDAGVRDLDEEDGSVIEAVLAKLEQEHEKLANQQPIAEQLVEKVSTVVDVDIPVIELGNTNSAAGLVLPRVPEFAPEEVHEPPAASEPEPARGVPSIGSDTMATRKRTILPADFKPNTPEAVAHLLNQPGVIAIVDARSTCSRTGIRPSELFERIALLRDHFDVPVEVIVTPVSTPVGGAPDLPAIGVHHVTGADTVADRIRALCKGFPADQPLVVIAGDDHVRRAAIGEEANVVEPAAIVNLAAE